MSSWDIIEGYGSLRSRYVRESYTRVFQKDL
jgi:hypothetical protein